MTDHEDHRPPIDPDAADAGTGDWRIEVIEQTASTNVEVENRFRAGEDEGLVLVAEHQTAGRGRMDREWVTPPRSSLTLSFLLLPEGIPADRWSWLPLLTGVAAADAVRRVTGVDVQLKWPNDLLVADGHKIGGILLERVEDDGVAAAIVGVGINCSQRPEELPIPEAASLQMVTGGPVDRLTLLTALVEELSARYDQWRAGTDMRPAYLERCATPGQDVRVTVPGGEVLGRAVDVDAGGRLVVRTEAGEEQHLGAGDVVYVRPQE